MNIFQLIIYILVILFGLSVGSFLNVLIARFDELRSVISTRSHCPHCKKNLPWYDLVPFFSYFILNGKCRSCRKNISIQYPLVELITALIFACIYYHFGTTWESLLLAFIFSLLIVIATYDLIHSEIPDFLTYAAIVLAIGYQKLLLWQSGEILEFEAWLPILYGLAIGFGFFGILVLASREKWMGWGDVILASFMGVFLGYPNILVALFLAFVFGSLVSLVLIAFKKKTLKDAVPFGPFLVASTFAAFFWGSDIIDVYFLRMGL